jgi:UMF1 family MFS transporter
MQGATPAPEGRADRSRWASKGELLAWMLFDFGNSSYTTLIVTLAFPLYFTQVVVGDSATGEGDRLWGAANLASQLLVVASAPIVGAIADHSGSKKRFLFLTYLGCVLGTASLKLVGPGDVTLALALFIVTNVLFSSGENLIAAFLPELAPPEKLGRISGMGWGIGYVGGLLTIAACYPFLSGDFIEANLEPLQNSHLVIALFFFLGGLPTFLFLRDRGTPRPLRPGRSYVGAGFRQVWDTLRHVRRHRQLTRFLFVFLFYNAGIGAVISFASIVAKDKVGLDGSKQLVFFIIVNASAAVGALGFGFLQDRIGARRSIILSLCVWLGVCAGAWLTSSPGPFYWVGSLAGIAMGASLSGGRALVGTFSPPQRSAEFFGFWGLFWKLSTGLGPWLFGSTKARFGLDAAILLLAASFVAGIIGMLWIDERAGRDEASRGGGAA